MEFPQRTAARRNDYRGVHLHSLSRVSERGTWRRVRLGAEPGDRDSSHGPGWPRCDCDRADGATDSPAIPFVALTIGNQLGFLQTGQTAAAARGPSPPGVGSGAEPAGSPGLEHSGRGLGLDAAGVGSVARPRRLGRASRPTTTRPMSTAATPTSDRKRRAQTGSSAARAEPPETRLEGQAKRIEQRSHLAR